jgi:hypothetical protein
MSAFGEGDTPRNGSADAFMSSGLVREAHQFHLIDALGAEGALLPTAGGFVHRCDARKPKEQSGLFT